MNDGVRRIHPLHSDSITSILFLASMANLKQKVHKHITVVNLVRGAKYYVCIHMYIADVCLVHWGERAYSIMSLCLIMKSTYMLDLTWHYSEV